MTGRSTKKTATAAIILVFGLAACKRTPDETIVSATPRTAVAVWCESHVYSRDELHTTTYAVPDGTTARIGQIVPRGWRRLSSESRRTEEDCG